MVLSLTQRTCSHIVIMLQCTMPTLQCTIQRLAMTPLGAAPDVSACPTTEVPFALPDTVLIATLMNAGKLPARPRQLLQILATCSEHGVAVEINATPWRLDLTCIGTPARASWDA